MLILFLKVLDTSISLLSFSGGFKDLKVSPKCSDRLGSPPDGATSCSAVH